MSKNESESGEDESASYYDEEEESEQDYSHLSSIIATESKQAKNQSGTMSFDKI